MKNKFLLFALSISLILITANVSHTWERGSPAYGIEKQDVMNAHFDCVQIDALHVETSGVTVPGQVPLPDYSFVAGDVPLAPTSPLKHPPEKANTQIVLYNLRC